MGKPTVHDIAREAKVSLATVDRALNGRPGVRQKTADRVFEAVQNLGYVRDNHAANLARRKLYRFVFVLPEGRTQFVEMLKSALQEAAEAQIADRVVLKTVLVSPHDPHAMARAIRALDPAELDGAAIMVPETPHVRDAAVHLRKQGVPVVALVSDLPHSARDHFVGINNVSAGRTAATLLGRFISTPGSEIMVVTNSMQAHDSIDRRLGFDQVITGEFSHLKALPSLESHDDPQRMLEIVGHALHRHPGIVGVYSMGPSNRFLLDALERSGRARELVVVAHELTPMTRQALLEKRVDAVITQDVGHLVRSSLRVLRAKCDSVGIYAAQERVRIEIVIRENLPEGA